MTAGKFGEEILEYGQLLNQSVFGESDSFSFTCKKEGPSTTVTGDRVEESEYRPLVFIVKGFEGFPIDEVAARYL